MTALVSVSGACSRAGKTALAVGLLRALARGEAAAVKFTTTEDVLGGWAPALAARLEALRTTPALSA